MTPSFTTCHPDRSYVEIILMCMVEAAIIEIQPRASKNNMVRN
jgi:hypothetical protein